MVMEEVFGKLREFEGVKSVKRHSGTLRIDLFSRPIPGSEAEETPEDLRSISQKLGNIFDNAHSEGLLSSWEWMVKPEKQYTDSSPVENISDRKDKGYRPSHYRVSFSSKE